MFTMKKRAGHLLPFFLPVPFSASHDAAIPLWNGCFLFYQVVCMEKIKKDALQAAKEITCKFIETRTVSPANFPEVFPCIYKVVLQTLLQCENPRSTQELPRDE